MVLCLSSVLLKYFNFFYIYQNVCAKKIINMKYLTNVSVWRSSGIYIRILTHANNTMSCWIGFVMIWIRMKSIWTFWTIMISINSNTTKWWKFSVSCIFYMITMVNNTMMISMSLLKCSTSITMTFITDCFSYLNDMKLIRNESILERKK